MIVLTGVVSDYQETRHGCRLMLNGFTAYYHEILPIMEGDTVTIAGITKNAYHDIWIKRAIIHKTNTTYPDVISLLSLIGYIALPNLLVFTLIAAASSTLTDVGKIYIIIPMIIPIIWSVYLIYGFIENRRSCNAIRRGWYNVFRG